MSKRTRTILFFILVIIFVITTPLVILYGEGYRFDFENKRIIETGGIFIKTFPGEANILINDKKEKTTSNFLKSVLIQNLVPKTYNIKINKIGFLPWEKNIEVTEKKVSEIDINLFKNSYDKTVLNENILDIYKIENGFILKKETGFYYYNPENNKEDLITKITNWDNVEILKNDLLAKKGLKYYLMDSASLKEFNNIGQINFKKDNLNNLYYQIENRLYKNNELIKTNIDLYELHHNTVYYFRDGFLYRDEAKLINDKLTFEENKNYKLLFIYNKIFLNENNEKLYLLDDNEFKKIINLNNHLEYSEWDGKILINTGNEIWIYFSKETHYPEFTNGNTLKLIARFQDKIKDLYFINDKYYTFTKDKDLIISEFDYRDKINIFTIANNSDNSKTFFNYDNKNIYIFENNSLYSINKIVP